MYVPHDEQQSPLIFEDHTEEVVAEARMLLNEEQFEAAIEIVEGSLQKRLSNTLKRFQQTSSSWEHVTKAD